MNNILADRARGSQFRHVDEYFITANVDELVGPSLEVVVTKNTL